MLNYGKGKITFILTILFLSVYFLIPNFYNKTEVLTLPTLISKKQFNLGLDLQGGSHLLLEVDTNSVLKEKSLDIVDDIRKTLRKNKIKYLKLGSKGIGATVSIKDSEEQKKAITVLRDVIGKEVQIKKIDNNKLNFVFSDIVINEFNNNTLEQSIEVIRKRVDESGTREPNIQKQGEDRIIVQLPGLKDPERIKALIGRTAKLNFHLLDQTTVELANQRGKLPPGTIKINNYDPNSFEKEFLVKKRVLLSGDRLNDAAATVDPQTGRYVVAFEFDNKGAKKFAKITTDNTFQRLAIILDNKVISAPQIREPITGGQGNISGNFSPEAANDLAVLLRAGSLPAPIKVLEERTVGPSLGADSILAGKKALILGFILVIVFMILKYSLFGIFANVALIFNLFIIVSVLSLIEGTLTMPGIAGIVLTVGMAVDANVLVFERIKEEFTSGRSPINSVDLGYKQALKTILDANITTLIAALLLFNFGSGPIKGFAVTLSIGIISSMFTALMLTRLLIVIWLRKFKPNAVNL
ncbi:MAG: protein translocase subunit SecD [Rickettsiales bacterium]|nr:protein translocase subunit SecD [Rickettsiales bacterium]OUV52835.1 MAG: protein translocase subunit SecD [Rickettsiales bacterium TMED127]|tara:strand:- start:17837 stop:19414 length:1578 start_codon:yes stop_codon:yes gene_type:complete